MSNETAEILRTAFDAYLARRQEGELEPSSSYLAYDFDHIGDLQWQLMGGEMVKDELRELTNILNHWHSSLQRWQVWNGIIDAYNENEAWELRREFLEALVHHCLLLPSAVRDTFSFVATNSLHQVRLAAESDYKDYLEGDPKTPNDRPIYLTRRKKEKRLANLVSRWRESADFMTSLRRIDDEAYRKKTSDYRNRNSHSIGPRLGIGITQTVVRNVVQATRMVKQADGTWAPTPIPGKLSPSYGFGGTLPLNMEEARAANLEQYQRARSCYESYRKLLAAGTALISPAN